MPEACPNPTWPETAEVAADALRPPTTDQWAQPPPWSDAASGTTSSSLTSTDRPDDFPEGTFRVDGPSIRDLA
jgi:hypothetical protein